MSSLLFPKPSNDFTIKERINVVVARHENRYFLNTEYEINENDKYDPYIKPSTRVTDKNLKDYLTKDARTKNKKLHWAITTNEEFTADFRRKYEENVFKTVEQAKIEACTLWKEHNESYQKSKAVVTSVDGQKQVAKKARIAGEKLINQADQQNENNFNHFKQRLLQTVGEFALEKIQSATNDVTISNVQRLKTQLAEENDGNSYLTALTTYRVATNAKTTFANYLLTVFHEIISQHEEAEE